MLVHAFQQAHRPSSRMRYAPAPQQDALALQTLSGHNIAQTHLGYWTCAAPGGFAWLSVADGVASSPCADLASRSFLQVLHRTSPATPLLQARQLPSLVRQALLEWRARYLRPRTRGAACTLASLLVADGQVCAANSGDARIWRLRTLPDGGWQWLQLSRDHTAWQQMLDEGEVYAEQAGEAASIYHGLLHCLVLDTDGGPATENSDEEAAPDDWLHVWHGQLKPGDIYLLATDGLHGALSDAHIQALWQRASSPQDGLHALCEAYRLTGAEDDVSAILLQQSG